jgi:hypothetical protein
MTTKIPRDQVFAVARISEPNQANAGAHVSVTAWFAAPKKRGAL